MKRRCERVIKAGEKEVEKEIKAEKGVKSALKGDKS